MTPRITSSKDAHHLERKRSNGRANRIAAISKFQGHINRVRLALHKMDDAAHGAGLGDACELTIAQLYARLDEMDNTAADRRREYAEELK